MILQFVQFDLKKFAHLNWPVKNLSVTYTIVQLPPPTTILYLHMYILELSLLDKMALNSLSF